MLKITVKLEITTLHHIHPNTFKINITANSKSTSILDLNLKMEHHDFYNFHLQVAV